MDSIPGNNSSFEDIADNDDALLFSCVLLVLLRREGDADANGNLALGNAHDNEDDLIGKACFCRSMVGIKLSTI